MNPWDLPIDSSNYPGPSSPAAGMPVSFKNEASLAGIAGLAPSEQAEADAQDQQPGNLQALDQEIQKAPNANVRATLQQEKARLTNNQSGPWSLPQASPWDLPQEASTASKIKSFITNGNPLAETVGSAAAALDTLAPVGQAVGGISGLGTLALGGPLKQAVENIDKFSAYSLGKLLEKYYPEAYQTYLNAQKPLGKLGEAATYVGEKTTEATNSPAIGTAANLLTQVLPFILGERALSKTVGTPTTTEALKSKGYTPGEADVTGASALEDMGVKQPTPAQPQQPMFTVKGKPIDAGAEQSLGVDATPEDMTQEFNQRQGAFNFDPLAQGETGDMFGPNQRVAGPDMTPERDLQIQQQARQSELPLTDQLVPEGRAPLPQGYEAAFDKSQGFKEVGAATSEALGPETADILGEENVAKIKEQQENSAWEKYKARVKAQQEMQARSDQTMMEQQAKYSSESFQPSQGSTDVQKMAPPVTNRAGVKFFGKQRGAVGNLGDADTLKSLLTTDRNPDTFKQGDLVRLMNGKMGRIMKVTQDGRYQIKHDDGSLDTVHRQGINYKFKPANQVLSDARRYPKSPFAGPGKKQAGALNVRAIFNTKDPGLKPEEPQPVETDLSKQDQIDITYKQYNRSSNLEAFQEGLRLENKQNPKFPAAIVDKAPELWENFEKGYRPEKSTYGQMENFNQRDSADHRPFEQAMKEIIAKNGKSLSQTHLTPDDDIGFISKEFFDPLHIISTNWSKAGGKLLNNVYSGLADINKQWSTKLGELVKNNEKFMALNRDSKLNTVNAERYWDTNVNRQVLIDRGLMWPTKDMLKDKQFTNLSEAEADAYLDHARGYDAGYEAAGIEQPKLPGYMPHTWRGAWKTEIYKDGELLEVFRGDTRWGANQAAKAAEAKGFHAEVKKPVISNKHDFVQQTQRQIEMASNYGKVGKLYAKILTEIQAKTVQGTITESLERKGVKGFLGDEGARPESLMHPYDYVKNRAYNNQLMGLFEKAMGDFARAGRNRQIIEGVAKPFYRNLDKLQLAKNFTDTVNDLINTATGFRANEAHGIDRWIKQMSIKFGVSPTAPRDFINFWNSVARIERINAANLGFAAEHANFALPGIFDLMRTHFERGGAGEKQGSFAKALGEFGKDFISFGQFRSAEHMRAEKWATNNGVYGSNYYDMPDYKKGLSDKAVGMLTHGTLNMVINRMKSVSFHMAYSYFKDIMPERQALEAAKNHTKKTMQSFDELDRPEIFKEGLGGTAIRTFNQIHVYNMARALEHIQAYAKELKSNPIMAQRYLMASGGLAAMYFLSAGAKGIPFHDDWDTLRHYWMEKIDKTAQWPSYEEWMMNRGLPDWAVFGALPTLTGADVRGTFTFNVTNAFSGAGIESAYAFMQLAYQKIKGALGLTKNPDSEYKNTRKLLPSNAVPFYEDAQAEKLGGNIPKPSELEPQTPRTPAEDLFFKISGKRAITESVRNEKDNIMKEIKARQERARGAYLDLIVKSMSGFDTGKDVGQLMDEAVNKGIGFDPASLNKELVNKIKELNLPAPVQFIEHAAKSNNLSKAAQFQALQQLLHGEQLGK